MVVRSRSMLARHELAAEILARRLGGETPAEIGDELALTAKQVQEIIDLALEERAEPIEGVRQIELGRLETLAAKFYQKASGGDARALAAYVKIHDRLAKIAGLHQPQKIAVTHSLGHPMVDAAVTYEITPEQIEAALTEYHRQSTDPLGHAKELVEAEIVEDGEIEDEPDFKRTNLWTK